MPTRRFVALLFLGSLLLACNFPLFAPATQLPPESSPTPSNTSLPALPSFTPAPSPSPTATTIPTPSVPQVTPVSVNVNCRSGPDVAYDSISVLFFGATTQVAGRNEDSSWWYVHDPSNPGAFCWISAGVVTIAGPIAGIPFIAPPPAIVSAVTVDVTLPPASSTFCGGPNAVSFSGTITTTGPAKVKFQWEISGDKSNTTSPQTLNFADAETQDAPDPGAYNVDCGNYKITLHVLSPNDTSAGKKFKVSP